MSSLKIKLKIGEHEFEGEGTAEDINAQVITFARLLGREEQLQPKTAPPPPPVVQAPSAIHQIAQVEGKIVSVTARGLSSDDIVLMLLLGQDRLRGNSAVAGTEIMEGLRASGCVLDRADYILKRHARSGFVVATGKRRRLRYRLTSDGAAKAQDIARTFAASAPEERATPAD